MDEWIELADGTVLDSTYVVKLTESNIAIYSYSLKNLPDAVALFSDHDKVKAIHSSQHGDVNDWIGFTEMESTNSFEGGVCVCLAKGGSINV